MHDYFLGIQGQESALKILSEIYNSKRIPHALLFTGNEGVGKFFTAIQFLQLLNNEASEKIHHHISQIAEPYVKLITPLPAGKGETNSDSPTSKLSNDNLEDIQEQIANKIENPYHKFDVKGANRIKISSIREINKIISLNYDEIAYRGIILLDAHKMSIEAQNAFLKNLEEPPEGIIYILISDNPDMLLTTIRSRCWEIHFNPLNNKALELILKERYGIKTELNKILNFSNGSVTNALFLLENDIEKLLQKTILILRYSLAKKYHTAAKEFNDVIADNSIISFQLLVDLIIAWFVEAQKVKAELENESFVEYSDTFDKFNQRFFDADIGQIVSKLVELRNAPLKNVSLNLTVMNVIFEIASIGIKAK